MRTLIAITAFAALTALSAGAAAQMEQADAALKQANKLASSGKLSKAVPKYREALQADPGGHPLGYYNLAEVYRALGECEDAVFMFQLYASVRQTEAARKEADAGIQKCKGTEFPTLAVKAQPSEDARVMINGFLASYGDFGPAALPPGSYEVEVTAIDHESFKQTVELGEEGVALDVELEKLTFYGKVRVEANVEGARVRVFAGPSDKTAKVHEVRTPMKDGVKVEEGRHFIELTAKGYNRWIRNVSVLRDDETVVRVEMSRSTE
jgi:tetratricopeptide (TPR) repeat protein